MFKKITFASLILVAFNFQNCKTDDGGDDPGPAVITAPTFTLPSSIKSVDGILAAISTTTKKNTVPLIVGSAYATFFKNQNPATNFDAGTVKINTKTTSKSNDNIYFYTSSVAEPNGLIYNSQVLWDVSGNTSNGVPVIYDNDGNVFPNTPNVPESIIMFAAQDKSISWSTSSGADSVIFLLVGPTASYKRVFSSSVTSHTITAAEITKLGKGAANLQIINYKLTLKPFGGKQYAFIKQSVGICNNVTISN